MPRRSTRTWATAGATRSPATAAADVVYGMHVQRLRKVERSHVVGVGTARAQFQAAELAWRVPNALPLKAFRNGLLRPSFEPSA